MLTSKVCGVPVEQLFALFMIKKWLKAAQTCFS